MRPHLLLQSAVFTLGLLVFSVAGLASNHGILYYSRTDGSVAGIDIVTGDDAGVIAANHFIGANPGAGREIAFDPENRLLWYSATDGNIYSVHIETLQAGPNIRSIPGANEGAGRHLYIDYARRTLLTPVTDGSVQIYRLSDQSDAGSIPGSFFTDGNVGGFRHLASDVRTGTIWYAATDGSFREMNPDTLQHTQRTIPFNVQIGANPGAFRHFVVDPRRNLLIYAVTDGSVASINLSDLSPGAVSIPSANFDGADPGAGRIITYDLRVIAVRPTFQPESRELSLNWTELGSGFAYVVETRPSIHSGDWEPVPPSAQWPKQISSFDILSLTGTSGFFRVRAVQTGN